MIGFERYRLGDRQLLIGIGSADQEKLLIGRSIEIVDQSLTSQHVTHVESIF